MRRRDFVLLLAGAMTAAHALRAQQKAMPVIGWLSVNSPPQTRAIWSGTRFTRAWPKLAMLRHKIWRSNTAGPISIMIGCPR